MQITRAQMVAFEQASWRRLASRLATYVSDDCRELTHAYDGTPVPCGVALEQAVEQLIAEARMFGLTTELGLGQFVVAGLGYSMKFHSIPKVAEWLMDPRATPEENMQRVINAILVAEAKAAR
jgi:hypothetical protein